MTQSLRGVSASSYLAFLRPDTLTRVLREIQTDCERGREASGWETAPLAPRTCWWLCSEAKALPQWNSLGRQDRDSEKDDSVPRSLDCSPQPPCPLQAPLAPSFPATHTQAALVLWSSPSGFPHSCEGIHLLVSSSSPSQLHPSPWDSGSVPPPAGSLPGACGAASPAQSPSSSGGVSCARQVCRAGAGPGPNLCALPLG